MVAVDRVHSELAGDARGQRIRLGDPVVLCRLARRHRRPRLERFPNPCRDALRARCLREAVGDPLGARAARRLLQRPRRLERQPPQRAGDTSHQRPLGRRRLRSAPSGQLAVGVRVQRRAGGARRRLEARPGHRVAGRELAHERDARRAVQPRGAAEHDAHRLEQRGLRPEQARGDRVGGDGQAERAEVARALFDRLLQRRRARDRWVQREAHAHHAGAGESRSGARSEQEEGAARPVHRSASGGSGEGRGLRNPSLS
mmetsp:Transcript_23870/g.76984  ORF Transcript_23870/g.76984 Transcript_23870/m.76984 type:complete len:258 (-) Transcript_23870:72-845(-)